MVRNASPNPATPSPVPADLKGALAGAVGRLGRLGSPLLYFPSTGSTNDVAAAIAASGKGEGATVLADAQTAGRGRRGREWFSPPGSGLYVSVVLAPGRAATEPDRAVRLVTITAGVALAEGIEAQTGLRASIKWPNDLMVDRRKLAGILAEGIVPDARTGPPRGPGDLGVVVGYGVNVEPAAYPDDLRDRATSLESELGRAVDRAGLFVQTLVTLAARYDDLLAGRFDAILDAWRTRARGAEGARVTWDTASGRRRGITIGIDRDGALLVQTQDSVERIVSGELRWECF